MSAAAVEHPCDPCDGELPTLLEEADRLIERLPGYRVEIIGGVLTATPPPVSRSPSPTRSGPR